MALYANVRENRDATSLKLFNWYATMTEKYVLTTMNSDSKAAFVSASLIESYTIRRIETQESVFVRSINNQYEIY